MLPNFTYLRPQTLTAACRELAVPGTRLHAGGTDLLGCLRDGVFGADRLLAIGRLAELAGIRESSDGSLHIGALTTIAEVASNPRVRLRFAALADAAAVVASPQLRNQGTLGGNLCQKPRCWYYRGHYHCLRKGGEKCFAVEGENEHHCIFGGDRCYIVHPSDTAPALVALSAIARVEGPGGSRSLPVEKLHVPPSDDPQRETYLEPGEILTEVVLPPPADGMRSAYRKVSSRAVWDFALAGVALALRMEGKGVAEANVVLSGAAPVPWRSKGAEAALTGRALTDGTIAEAAQAAVAGAEPLERNRYKIPLFKGLLSQELARLR